MKIAMLEIVHRAEDEEARILALDKSDSDARIKKLRDALELHAKLFPKAMAALLPFDRPNASSQLEVWSLFTRTEEHGWMVLMLHEAPGALAVIESCLEDGSAPLLLLQEDYKAFRKEYLKRVGKRIPGVLPASSLKGTQPEHIVLEAVRAFLKCTLDNSFKKKG